MSIGTLFTLFVVPMFYTFIAKEAPKAAEAEESSLPVANASKPHPTLLAAE
jgi:hypothetical protein